MQPHDAHSKPFNVMDFLRDDRIHVEHGSKFDPADPLLLVHPRELRPENSAQLQAKITEAYSMDKPSFFEDEKKAPIAQALGSLLPLSGGTQAAAVQQQQNALLQQQQTGISPAKAQQAWKEANPMAAVIQSKLQQPAPPPLTAEQRRNGIAMYLMVDEALYRQKFREPLTKLVTHTQTPSSINTQVSETLKLEPAAFETTVQSGNVQAIGDMLGLEPAYVQEVAQMASSLTGKHFSANHVQSWKVGNRLEGMQGRSIDDKMAAGQSVRIQARMSQLQSDAQGIYDVPTHVLEQEQHVVGALRNIPPALAETLHLMGAEFAYTPHSNLTPITKGHGFGFHRRITNDPTDTRGITHIFLSAKQNEKEFAQLVAHETHHLLFPATFTPEEISAADSLAQHDAQRIADMYAVTSEWQKGTLSEAEAAHKLQSQFDDAGLNFADAMKDTSMLTLHNLVSEANNMLRIDSATYRKTPAYGTVEARFQELNSRYAELRCVGMVDKPKLLEYVTPGLTQSYDHIYMPHIERQRDIFRAEEQQTGHATPHPAPKAAPIPPMPTTTPHPAALATHHAMAPLADDMAYDVPLGEEGLAKNSIATADLQHNPLLVERESGITY